MEGLLMKTNLLNYELYNFISIGLNGGGAGPYD